MSDLIAKTMAAHRHKIEDSKMVRFDPHDPNQPFLLNPGNMVGVPAGEEPPEPEGDT